MKLAITLERAVSLNDVTRHPVLADLAGWSTAKSRVGDLPGLLTGTSEDRDASAAAGGESMALVCFPYAGGNAVNFQPMATCLAGQRVAVYAVELPGHDLAAGRKTSLRVDGAGGRARSPAEITGAA